MNARVMFERERLTEGRDDLGTGKVNVPHETKSYARMTSSDVMDQPGGTARKWTKSLELRKAITNQRDLKGFKAMDKSEKTEGGKLKEGDEKWLKKAVNPKHKGWCTPLSNPHCTGRRRALAMRFKKGDLHHEAVTPEAVVSRMLED